MTVSTLSRYLRCTRADIGFILETRCGRNIVSQRIQHLPLYNSEIVPSNESSGGSMVDLE